MSAKETTENFWKAWNSIVWPESRPPIYRLYYKSDGSPDFYTMEELPGQYVEVSRELYLKSSRNVRVTNGCLEILPVKKTYDKLTPNQSSGTSCHPKDVCVVINGTEPSIKWNIKAHEIH